MKRVLLKLSGEAFAGKDGNIYDTAFVDEVAATLKEAADLGFELGVVIGAGNIWRGRQGGEMDRATADYMGMLATEINALCLKDALLRAGAKAIVQSSVPMPPFAEGYTPEKAKAALAAGTIVVFGGGLGVPFMSTDTAGAVRAAEIGADAMLMAKNVDYIYSADPRNNPDAQKLPNVKASEILSRGLRAIDFTAAAFAMSADMPIRIFGLQHPRDILKALRGEKVGTVVSPD